MGRARVVVGTGALVLLPLGPVLSSCGSDEPPATLELDLGADGSVIARASDFMERCYRDGSEPETCTSGTIADLYTFCADLVGSADLQTADVIGAVTAYPADNERIGEVSCLFNNPRSSLSLEVWRDPPATLCSEAGGAAEPCVDAGEDLEAGRSADRPTISVAGLDGAVVSIVSSATLDGRQLASAAAVLASAVFDQAVTPEDLAALQSSSAKPE